jgi:hypothetical protein
VYTALRNLFSILKEPGANFRPGKLKYGLSAPGTVHHLLLQKSDGSFYLALWNEVDSYKSSQSGGSDLFNTPVPVTLSVSKANRAVVYAPNDPTGQNPTEAYTKSASTTKIELNVPDQVILIKIPGQISQR